MSKRPEPVMACAECGPVITEQVYSCPLCGSAKVSWMDLAAGLQHLADMDGEYMAPESYDLLMAAANELRTLRDTVEAMQTAQGGAKRRRQEEKARRLAEVIREWARPTLMQPISAVGLLDMPDVLWLELTHRVNQRYPSDPIREPSSETKALVAAKFAEPQEAPDAAL